MTWKSEAAKILEGQQRINEKVIDRLRELLELNVALIERNDRLTERLEKVEDFVGIGGRP